MPQDMPPKGGYAPIQYKVRFPCHSSSPNLTNTLISLSLSLALLQRNIIPLTFKPGWWLLGVGAIMVYGWSKLIPGMRELKSVLLFHPPAPSRPPSSSYSTNTLLFPAPSELGREKMWSRFYIAPLLQAEEDRDQYRRWLADQERERALLGKATSAYNSDRFVRPTYATLPLRRGSMEGVIRREEADGQVEPIEKK